MNITGLAVLLLNHSKNFKFMCSEVGKHIFWGGYFVSKKMANLIVDFQVYGLRTPLKGNNCMLSG